MTIGEALHHARQILLSGGCEEAEREAIILLQAVMGKNRGFFHAFPEWIIDDSLLARFWSLVERRRAGEPIAYILGVREFWSLPLNVTPATLIPRPETELLVELTLALPLAAQSMVADLGTGCGAIACALAAERPTWRLVAVDRSEAALAVAQDNVAKLGLPNVRLAVSDWFTALSGDRFQAIVSNPPYVAREDGHLQVGDLRFEPRSALVAGDDGLEDIRCLIPRATAHLAEDGWLLCEHGHAQGAAVRTLMSAAGYVQVQSRLDLAGRERVTMGCWNSKREKQRGVS